MQGPASTRRHARLGGEDDEARGVVLGILDVGAQDLQAVDLRRRGARRSPPRRARPEAATSAARAGGVGMHPRRDAELADQAAALAQRLDVRAHRADVLEAWRRAGPAGGGSPAGNARRRCAGRNAASGGGCPRPGPRPSSRSGSCASLGAAVAHAGERVLEGLGRQRSRARDRPAGRRGASRRPAGPERRSASPGRPRAPPFRSPRQRARPLQEALRSLRRSACGPRLSGEHGPGALEVLGSIDAPVERCQRAPPRSRVPFSSARSCSRRSRRSSGLGGSTASRSSAARR